MKATLISPHVDNAGKFRKDRGLYEHYTVIAIYPDQVKEAVVARIYSTSSTCNAAVWIQGPVHFRNGGGKTNGCGFHRPSAALSNALSACGVKLDDDIHGRGDQAMKDALLAVARISHPDARLHVVRGYA
jgi:hypothetical protein